MRHAFRTTLLSFTCALALSACGQPVEKSAPPSAENTSVATTTAADAAWPHGEALCDLIAAHFGAVLPANAARQLYPSGDMCKLGGSPPGQPRAAQVRVVATSRGGMTPALLASYRVAGHTIADTPDLGEGAFSDTFDTDRATAKVNFVTQKNGHLVTIEIEYARPITAADSESALTMARDFVAAP